MRKCAFDKTRTCDESCTAFVKDKRYLFSELHFDKSNVVPQFDWKKTLVVRSDWCNRSDTEIGEHTIIKRVKDGKVIEE